MEKMYNLYSVCEKGTLYQPKNVINQRNIKPSPKNNITVANIFLSIITTCHILAATMKLMEMEDLNAIPVDENVNENTWMLPDKDRKQILKLLCRKVINTYTNFKLDLRSPPELSDDHVYAYAVEMMSFGLFHLSFKDAIKHGNGVHVLCCWKYLIQVV